MTINNPTNLQILSIKNIRIPSHPQQKIKPLKTAYIGSVFIKLKGCAAVAIIGKR